MGFTRSRKLDNSGVLKLKRNNMPKEVTCLVIIIDFKSTWNWQLQRIKPKAKPALMLIKRTQEKMEKWGS